MDDALWQAVKARQGDITERYATVIEAVRSTHATRPDGARRPRHLLSGLLECGVCGGPCAMRGQDRYGCSNHVMNGSCANSRGIPRTVLEERVLAGLKEKLMAPEAAAEAIRAWAEETNRLNRERRAAGEADRRELAAAKKKKMATMIGVIKDGGGVRGMVGRLRELLVRRGRTEGQAGRGAGRRSRRPPERDGHLLPEGGAMGRCVEQPGRARRGRGGGPEADRAHRANARPEAGRDARRAPRRLRHRPRMGREPERGESDRHPAAWHGGPGGNGGRT